MNPASSIQAPNPGARGAAPQLPRRGAVVLEQVRVTGIALRRPALLVAALLALVTLFAASQVVSRGVDLTLNAWPTQLPGILGALLPFAVWARDERFGPAFLWTLPVDRRRHALAKVLAGWVWLMAGVACFVVWILVATWLSGGRALPPDTLHLLESAVYPAEAIDPATLRTVRWAPGPVLLAVPFTGATATYLLGSALLLASRHPLRWVVGALLAYVLSSIATAAASARLRGGWMADAPARLLGFVVDSRYGLDALLTARIESFSEPATLTTGAPTIVWWAVPDLADWGTATLCWTAAGVLALWAAASRHREGRGA